MSILVEKIKTDLTASLKARETLKVSTLRQILGTIQSAEKAGKSARIFSDDEVQALLFKEVKTRQESAETFAKAGRNDLFEKETAEADIISSYLPTPLGLDELEEIVLKVVAETGASSKRDMGKVMKEVKAIVGARIDGQSIRLSVEKHLA